ncbi:hypothetical protein [Peribacillus frigoritolerans]|uniref:hypothetical protein n=1 Tax=Peribacillus frigoritolerans TaxID=450367 RepID=UPI002079CFE7|nr:hypothetical protein [Peribacillus frigoritolerans]USK77301.1 hypothetical protein LIT31_12610 [Peribacillus frigoritolerans]
MADLIKGRILILFKAILKSSISTSPSKPLTIMARVSLVLVSVSLLTILEDLFITPVKKFENIAGVFITGILKKYNCENGIMFKKKRLTKENS